MRRTPRALVGLAAVALLAVTAGCDDSSGGEASDPWPPSEGRVATDGLVWATGSQVHLADGSVLEVDAPLGGYVVTAAGVWFLDAGDDDSLPRLRLARPDGELHDTDARPMAGSLATSADGRWLAFLDRPEGADGPAEAVVVDVVAGTEVLRSREGLVPGDGEDGVDWTDLYEELPVDVEGIVDETAYVRGLEETIAFDLGTGESSVAEPPLPDEHPAWLRALRPVPPYWNPARTWVIPEQPGTRRPVLRQEGGRAVTTRVDTAAGAPPPLPGGPDLESWTLTGWLDDTTAVGLTRTLDPSDPRPVPLTCTVPSGRCEVVTGAEGGVNLPLDRPTGLPSSGQNR